MSYCVLASRFWSSDRARRRRLRRPLNINTNPIGFRKPTNPFLASRLVKLSGPGHLTLIPMF